MNINFPFHPLSFKLNADRKYIVGYQEDIQKCAALLNQHWYVGGREKSRFFAVIVVTTMRNGKKIRAWAILSNWINFVELNQNFFMF